MTGAQGRRRLHNPVAHFAQQTSNCDCAHSLGRTMSFSACIVLVLAATAAPAAAQAAANTACPTVCRKLPAKEQQVRPSVSHIRRRTAQ